MVVGRQAVEVLQDLLRLVGRELVDALGEVAVDEDALPAGDWVGPNNGVAGLEGGAVVVGVAADALAEVVAELVGDCEEELAVVGSGQAFEEGGIRRRKAIVGFVAARWGCRRQPRGAQAWVKAATKM